MFRTHVGKALRWAKRQRRGRLESHTRAFQALFPPEARVERVAGGFRFTEGPVWLRAEDCLLFTDIPANRIHRLTSSGVETFREPSGHANGLTLDREDRLITCEHSNRRVTRTECDGSVSVLADSFDGKRLNSPNDVIVLKDRSIVFTDPPYGIRPQDQEQRHQGVYRIAPSGELTLMVDDFDRPNGLAVSPDQSKLYVDDSSELRHIRVFDVEPHGVVNGGRIFAELHGPGRAAPDGIKIDESGNVFCAAAQGVWVFSSAGVHLGTIRTPEKPSNCSFGGIDSKTLYITAETSIYSVRVRCAGLR